MTALRTMAAKTLLAATAVVAAALGVGVATAAPANAATYPGPAYQPGGDVLAKIDGTTGNPGLIWLNTGSSRQVIDDDHDLSTWGNKAQTWSQNGTNAQRVYLHRVDTRQLTYAMPVSGASSPAVGSISAGAYKIMHYTADGHVLCLDADGTGGAAPGAGARVGWYGCDPNAVNQPNQLWAFGPVAGRPDDQWETQPALVNLGSLPDPQNMDIRNAPILTAAANAAGTSSPLSLQAQANATAANSSWILSNADPGATDGCNYFDC